MVNPGPVSILCSHCAKPLVLAPVRGSQVTCRDCQQTYTLEGWLPGGTPKIVTTRLIPQCDFCGDNGATWLYPAEPFIVRRGDGMDQAMNDTWAACSACHRLVEQDDYAALIERRMDKTYTNPRMRSMIEKIPPSLRQEALAAIRRDVTMLIEGFRRARRGPARHMGEVPR